jgi:hypothetical protein
MASGTVRAFGALVVLPLAMTLPAGVASRSPSARDRAMQAAEYIRAYDAALVEVVGEERYEQRSEERTGHRTTGRLEQRTRSTIGWVKLPGLHDSVAVREVVELNGVNVQDSPRLQQMLQAPADRLKEHLKDLLNESAAYNLAPGSRNINFPTFPIMYLRRGHLDRSRWVVDEIRGSDSERVVVISFEEQRSPAIVRSESKEDLPGRGRFWLDATTGRVERAEVQIRSIASAPTMPGVRSVPSAGRSGMEMSYQLNVTFSADERLDLWLPSRMEDVYERSAADSYVRVDGEATYSKYRRFETGGRVVDTP